MKKNKTVILQKGDIVTLKSNTYNIVILKYKMYLEKYIGDKISGKAVVIRDIDLIPSIKKLKHWDHNSYPHIFLLPTIFVSPVGFYDIQIGVPLETIDLRKPLLRGQCKISLIKSQVSIQS